MAIGLGASAAPAAPPWQLSLETVQPGAVETAMVALDDGGAVLLDRVADANGGAVELRTYDGTAWSAPVRIADPAALPAWNGRTAEIVGAPLVVARDRSGLGAAALVVGVQARYSRAVLDGDGLLYAVFLARWEGGRVGPWQRVTPVGPVFDAAMDVDTRGRVWVAWGSATNLAAGEVQASWWDPSTGEVGAVEVLDAASQDPAHRGCDVVASPVGVWVTYRAPEGLFARALTGFGQGPALPRIPIVEGPYPPSHAAAWADHTLWVVTEERRMGLYRLEGRRFVAEPIAGMQSMYTETDTYLEAIDYSAPSIAARPEGGVAIAASRLHHFEDYTTAGRDFDRYTTVAAERAAGGPWAPETTITDGAWTNVGGAMASSRAALWVAGTRMESQNTVFAAMRAGTGR